MMLPYIIFLLIHLILRSDVLILFSCIVYQNVVWWIDMSNVLYQILCCICFITIAFFFALIGMYGYQGMADQLLCSPSKSILASSSTSSLNCWGVTNCFDDALLWIQELTFNGFKIPTANLNVALMICQQGNWICI